MIKTAKNESATMGCVVKTKNVSFDFVPSEGKADQWNQESNK